MRLPWLKLAIVIAGGSALGVAAGGAVTSGLSAPPAASADTQSWAERFHQSPSGSVDASAGDGGYVVGHGYAAGHGYGVGDAAPSPLPVTPDPQDVQRVAASCTSCSDYDLGYRWAQSNAIGDVSQCLGFSWSYQRGCIDFAREGRGARRDPDA